MATHMFSGDRTNLETGTCSTFFAEHLYKCLLKASKQPANSKENLAFNFPSFNEESRKTRDEFSRCYNNEVLAIVNALLSSEGPENSLRLIAPVKPEPRMLGQVGVAGLLCRNLGEALNLSIKYQSIIQQLASLKLVELGNYATLVVTSNLEDEAHNFVTMLVLTAYIQIGRNLVSDFDTYIHRVDFHQSEPNSVSLYREFFKRPLQFNSAANAITFDKRLLHKALQQHSPILLSHVCQTLDTQMIHLKPDNSAKAKVIRYLRTTLSNKKPSLSGAAVALNIGERSLKRRLQAENTSYTELLSSVRRELAAHYVQESHMPMAEVSDRLGFIDQSAFTRAFKSWFNCTPGSYRKQHLSKTKPLVSQQILRSPNTVFKQAG